MFRDLDWFCSKGKPIVDALSGLVDLNRDVVAEITRFFPHGFSDESIIPEHQKRKGLARSVLNTVLYDVFVSDRIRDFYAKTPKLPFQRLLLQEDFGELCVDGNPETKHLYRRI